MSEAVRNSAASAVTYPLRTKELLEPGAEVSVPFRTRRACTIVDVIGMAPDVEVVAASFGRVRHNLRGEDGRATKALSSVLSAEPYEARAASFLIVTFRNGGTKPNPIAAELVVSDEHGPVAAEAEQPPPGAPGARKQVFDEDGDGASPPEAKRSAAATFIDSLIGQSPRIRSTKKAPKTSADARRARSPAARAAQATGGEKKRAAAPVPATAPIAPRVPKHLRTQRVMTRHKRAKLMAEMAATAPAEVSASGTTDEMVVTALDRGHAEMLALAFSVGMPLGTDARIGISCALAEATSTTVVAPSEVGLRLDREIHERLREAIDVHCEFEIAPFVIDRLQRAIAGEPEPEESVVVVDAQQLVEAVAKPADRESGAAAIGAEADDDADADEDGDTPDTGASDEDLADAYASSNYGSRRGAAVVPIGSREEKMR